MLNQIRKIIRRQSIVDWHQDRADLRDGIKRFELSVCVGRDVSNTITFPHTERLQSIGPTITSVEKLFVVQSQIAVHDSIAFGVELAGAAGKFERTERRFHTRKADDLSNEQKLSRRLRGRKWQLAPDAFTNQSRAGIGRLWHSGVGDKGYVFGRRESRDQLSGAHRFIVLVITDERFLDFEILQQNAGMSHVFCREQID
jgi:hypothetical protein